MGGIVVVHVRKHYDRKRIIIACREVHAALFPLPCVRVAEPAPQTRFLGSRRHDRVKVENDSVGYAHEVPHHYVIANALCIILLVYEVCVCVCCRHT